MSLKFPVSLVGKSSSGGDIPPATSLYDSSDNLLVSLQGDIPDYWNDDDTPYDAQRLEIGTSCTSIGRDAFNFSTSLQGTIEIPDSVSYIGPGAFATCLNIGGDLILLENLVTIGFQAFRNLNIVDKIVLPKSITNIGSRVFENCNDFTALYTNVNTAAWTSINALNLTTALNTIYVGPDVVGTYTSNFQGGAGMTVLNWDNYPEPIPN